MVAWFEDKGSLGGESTTRGSSVVEIAGEEEKERFLMFMEQHPIVGVDMRGTLEEDETLCYVRAKCREVRLSYTCLCSLYGDCVYKRKRNEGVSSELKSQHQIR